MIADPHHCRYGCAGSKYDSDGVFWTGSEVLLRSSEFLYTPRHFDSMCLHFLSCRRQIVFFSRVTCKLVIWWPFQRICIHMLLGLRASLDFQGLKPTREAMVSLLLGPLLLGSPVEKRLFIDDQKIFSPSLKLQPGLRGPGTFSLGL